jgi:uncharacterized protein (UPF0276 family)
VPLADTSCPSAVLTGFGLGLRSAHYRELGAGAAGVDWLEIVSENYLVPGGKPLHALERLRERYPMTMHGVSMSIGGADALDHEYLRQLDALAARVQPSWISDHLCWTGVSGRNLHDLLPMPFTQEALVHVASRVERVQERLRRVLVLENVSSYAASDTDEMREWEFVGELATRTGCKLLLDVNNVYVNARNHGFDAAHYIDALPRHSICQFHLAGHSDAGDHLVDTHDAPVCEAVWGLYEHAVHRFGMQPTMIERDDDIPALDVLVAELDVARHRASCALSEVSHAVAA